MTKKNVIPTAIVSTSSSLVPVKASVPVVIPKILIGIPVLSWSHESVLSFLAFWTDLMTYHQKGRKFHVGYKFVYRKPVHMAEEELAEFALQSGCTHILLMDDDILDVTADMLLKLLDADKDVIGGIMFTGGFPYAMCAFRRYERKHPVANMPILKGPARLYEIPPDQQVGVQKADLIPFAFTLIKTKIFKDLPKPWFECNTQAPTDSWFMDKVMKNKIEVYAHFDVWLNHHGVTRENRGIHFQLGLQEQQKNNQKQMIEMTPEDMRRHELMMTQKLQDAEAKVKQIDLGNQKFYDKGDKPIATLVKK